MTGAAQEHRALIKAREALHEGNFGAMHLYFVAHITAFPNDGDAPAEYLEATLSRPSLKIAQCFPADSERDRRDLESAHPPRTAPCPAP
jgi:hypothetical protein